MDDVTPTGPEVPGHPGAQPSRLRGLALDLTPMRESREFRLLWTGHGVSFFGSQMTYIAIPVQVFLLTDSSLAVGLLGLCELAALLLTAFVGGALADAWDRRRLIRYAELGLLAVSALLLANASLGSPRVWPLYVLSALAAACDAIHRPSLEALFARLVPREQQPAAAALRTTSTSLGALAGPAIAGVVIATAGVTWVYALDLLTFVASLTALSLMRATPPAPDATPPSLAAVREGFQYARSQPVLMGTYLADINAMLFGMPRALFPALAVERFGGPEVVGLLYAAPFAGSLLATATSGWTARVHRHGQAILWAIAAWGLAIIGFGFTGSLPLAVLLLAIAGGADMISGLFRMTVWNQTIPDHLRGRLASIEMLSYTTGPLLGDAEAGAVARIAGLQTSVVSGGVLCLVGLAALVVALPAFVRYDARDAAAARESAEALLGDAELIGSGTEPAE